MSVQKTVLAIFAHNDDEFFCIGTLANHADAGHRVVLLFLSRGENSTFVNEDERFDLSKEIEELLNVEIRYLDFPDSHITYTEERAYEVAEVIKEIKPDILITWNKYANVGEGHPDHRATSEITLNAITYARLKREGSPHEPHREIINVYKYFDHENYSSRRIQYVDVSHQEEKIRQFLGIYKKAYGVFPVVDYKFGYLKFMGRQCHVTLAEAFEVVSHSSAPKLLWG